MTIEQAWDALAAAGRIAEAHGVELEPTLKPDGLRLAFWRGRKLLGALTLRSEKLDACEGASHRELLEREVAAWLSAHRGAVAS